MDGPNVNKKEFKDDLVEREASDLDLPCLIDLGTCGLHVVHGVFRRGFENTGWKLDRILKSLLQLFNESPARIQDYTQITGSIMFPSQFGGGKWIENCSVAERAISIWENIKKYIYLIENAPKTKIPKCASSLLQKKIPLLSANLLLVQDFNCSSPLPNKCNRCKFFKLISQWLHFWQTKFTKL